MILRADRVAWHFEDGGSVRRIFEELDLAFEPGRSYAVTGPSGCGKTTLMSILSLLCRPSRGRVTYGERDLSALDGQEAQRFRRENVSLVFQTFRLLEYLTVREQLGFVAEARRRPEAFGRGLELVEEFDLRHALDRLPRQLSGGEKQRVALAQALMVAPPIVLADEPTASLDGDNAGHVTRVLTEYASSARAIVVAVSHDRKLIAACSREVPLGEWVAARGAEPKC